MDDPRLQDLEKTISEETDKKTEKTLKESVDVKKTVFFNELFDLKGIIKFLHEYNLTRYLFILFMIALFAHFAFSYTVNIKRFKKFIALTISGLLIYVLFRVLKSIPKFNIILISDEYSYVRPLISLSMIVLFIILYKVFNKLITNQDIHRYVWNKFAKKKLKRKATAK